MLEWIWLNAAKLRDFAAIFGALGTFLGVIFAVRRFAIERRLQREATARRIWAGVLRMAFDHPEYAEPVVSPHLDEQHRLKYTWFVSNVFNALDEILTSSDEVIWRRTAELMIGYHLPYLATAEFQKSELPTLSDELRSLIVGRTRPAK
jgi:hypothetical protein